MSDPIIFFVSIKVVSEANASFSRYWWEKTKRKNSINMAIDLCLRDIKEYPNPCDVIMTRSSKRELQDDNLMYAFKSIRDHLAYRIISKIDNFPPNLTVVDKKVNKGMYDSDSRISWHYKQEKGPIGFWVTIKERQNEPNK